MGRGRVERQLCKFLFSSRPSSNVRERCLSSLWLQNSDKKNIHFSALRQHNPSHFNGMESNSIPEPTTTSDVVDAYFSHLSVVDQVQNDAKVKFDCLVDLNLKPYGGAFDRTSFFRGEITTIKCFENNPLVRETLTKESGVNRVLVIDGGGSRRCALLGGEIAKIAEGNQWEGIVVNGCIRDTNEMRWCGLKIPILAVGTSPVPSSKRDPGVKDPKFGVTFGGVNFKSGSWVYADCDGVLVTREKGPLA